MSAGWYGALKEGHISKAICTCVRWETDKRSKMANQIEVGGNIDELVEVLLQEGVDVERGFQIVLDSYGTCNSITA